MIDVKRVDDLVPRGLRQATFTALLVVLPLVWSGTGRPANEETVSVLHGDAIQESQNKSSTVNYNCSQFYDDIPTVLKRLTLGGSHVLGQILGAQAWQANPNVTSIHEGIEPLLQHHGMIPDGYGDTIGLYHASVWYIFGANNLLFDDLQLLCPRTDYEWVFMCLHGVGHGGLIRARKQEWKSYTACSEIGVVTSGALRIGYEVCRQAPSSFLEYSCSTGFYHSTFEHLDIEANKDTFYPCVDSDFPHKGACWCQAFLVLTQYQTNAGQGSLIQQRARMMIERGKGGKFCSNLTHEDTLACMWGLATNLFFNGNSQIFSHYAFDYWGLTLNSTWINYVPVRGQDGYLTVSAEYIGREVMAVCYKMTPGPYDNFAQWHACITGAFGLWMSHMFKYRPMPIAERQRICTAFREEIKGATEAYLSHLSCMKVVKIGFHSFIPFDDTPDDRDEYLIYRDSRWNPTWDYWRTVQVDDEPFHAFMSPFDLGGYGAIDE